MSSVKKELKNEIFQNKSEFFQDFQGKIISADSIKMHDPAEE